MQDTLRPVHSASTGRYTLITVHDHRGTTAMNAAGVLPDFAGVACHDAWAPYDTYSQVTHALCNAHALRELQAVTDLALEGQWCWATQAADALRELNVLVNHAPAEGEGEGEQVTGPDPDALADAVDRYHAAVTNGAHETRARSGTLEKRHHALARRLIDRQDDYLRFTTDPRVPFDNNAAEVRHEVARDEWTRRWEGQLMMVAA